MGRKSRPKTKRKDGPKKAKDAPSSLGKGYPKSYPMLHHANGTTGGDFDNMDPAQFFNYHIEYGNSMDEPLPEDDYPLPLPEGFDRTKATWRDMVMYSLFHRPGYDEPLTDDEYAAKQKEREATERANTIAERHQAKAMDTAAGERLKEKAEAETLRTQGEDHEL
jgi:hypothetical protein